MLARVEELNKVPEAEVARGMDKDLRDRAEVVAVNQVLREEAVH